MLNIYMEIHVFSTLAYENKKEKKGNPPNHYLDKQTYIARDTWMPSLENWGGGLKILVHMQYQCQCVQNQDARKFSGQFCNAPGKTVDK